MNTMNRLALVCGALCVSMGVTWLLPMLFVVSLGEGLSESAAKVVWPGPTLMVVGTLLVVRAWGRSKENRIPRPVRIAIAGNILFLSFCSLEFSDGLLRQDGRIFYWTSVLFLPALFTLVGLALARGWAWWIARGLTFSCALFFVGLAVAIPFGDVRSHGEPVPAWGRVWMIFVTVLFLSTTVFVFRVLGTSETRWYFRLLPKPEQAHGEQRLTHTESNDEL